MASTTVLSNKSSDIGYGEKLSSRRILGRAYLSSSKEQLEEEKRETKSQQIS